MQIHKIFPHYLLIFCCFLLIPSAHAVNEHHYTVSYMGIPILNVSISTDIEGDVWTGQYQASIKPAFSYIYDINNTYEIRAEPNSWRPRKYIKQINEGRHHETQIFTYNRQQHSLTLPDGSHRGFPRGTHSLFSAMLWVQHHNWSAGESRTMSVEIDGQRWQIALSCLGEPELRGHGKPIRTHLVEAQFLEPTGGTKMSQRTDYLSANIAAKGRTLRLWIDTDTNIVYQIFVPMGPFSVKAVLTH